MENLTGPSTQPLLSSKDVVNGLGTAPREPIAACVALFDDGDPGLGYSLGYYAPGIKAHIYVYPVNERHPSHKNELEVAIGDVKRTYGQDAVLRQWEIVESEGYSYFSYVPKNEPNDISSIFVISSNDRFIKVRITFAEGRENREFFRSFMGDLFAIIPE